MGRYASEGLRGERDVVLAAVAHDRGALRCAALQYCHLVQNPTSSMLHAAHTTGPELQVSTGATHWRYLVRMYRWLHLLSNGTGKWINRFASSEMQAALQVLNSPKPRCTILTRVLAVPPIMLTVIWVCGAGQAQLLVVALGLQSPQGVQMPTCQTGKRACCYPVATFVGPSVL